MPFVLDSSVALAWVLPDEVEPLADSLFQRLREDHAIVPSILSLEVVDVLLVAQRRSRLKEALLTEVIAALRALPVEAEALAQDRDFGLVLKCAQRFALTSYDAAYLELAIRRGIPLATLDPRLRSAAKRAHVSVLP